MLQPVAEAAIWAVLGALTWQQLRRWQDRPSAGGVAAAEAPAEGKKARRPASIDIDAQAQAIVDAAEDDAQQHGTHIVGSSANLPDLSGGAGSTSGGSSREGSPAAADPPPVAQQQAAMERAAHAIVDATEEDRKVHIVGSSVNLPDMSANLKAKVTVSEAQQSDPRLLAAVYDDMALKFSQHGLNLDAVAAMQQYFEGLEGPGEASPLEYSSFPVPLPPGAVRLGVVFFQESNRRLAQLVHEAAREVVAALPQDFQYHVNRPSHYHITIYMTSQPHTLRPDPFNPASGGLPLDAAPAEQAAAAKPHPQTLAREIEAFRVAAAGTPAPRLEVHRLLMADSGTLLLCSVDHTGHLAQLRKRLRHAFPGGPPKQSTIVHASIARVLTPRQLSGEEIARVQAVCDRWTERLRGQRFNPGRISHIQEHTFTTVEGPRIPLPLKRGGSEN